MKKLFAVLLAFLVLSVCAQNVSAQQNASAPQKFALVIGNGNYTGISKLNNPVNDANDMEAALKSLGFTVEKVINGNLEQMEKAVINISRRLGGSRNTYGFFFYAGHGVQSNGENYLIPVAADNIRTETQLRERAVSLQFILDSFSEAGNELNMIVLDACRDNPFGWARSGSRGLSVVSRAPSGSIVMYATGANSTASDGSGSNGLFTGYLLSNIKTPGLSVFDVFDRTMTSVVNVTNGGQHPELSIRAGGTTSIYLGSRPTQQVAQAAPAEKVAPAAKIAPIEKAAPIAKAAMAAKSTAAASVTVPAGFVRINGGTFTMGSPANEAGRRDGETQHQVTVSSFSMGKNQVTVGEFRRFVNASGYKTESEKGDGGYIWTGKWEKKADASWKNPYFTQGDNDPVVMVTWNDAVQYCNWLSNQEGLTPAYSINGAVTTWNSNANGYRLPTEAEWEYACRAGTTTAFNTGTSLTTKQANHNDTLKKTTPVGDYAANAWGLYDMHGNVMEWCWDWFGAYPGGAQKDPSGAASGSDRLLRGGSCYDASADSRSAYRDKYVPSGRSSLIGFRVVRL